MDVRYDSLYKGSGSILPNGQDSHRFATESHSALSPTDLGVGVRAQVGRTVIETPYTRRRITWDLGDTAYPLGIFDYTRQATRENSEGERHAAKFLENILRVSLELEADLGESPEENAKDFLQFSKLVSFLANIHYVPREDMKGKSLSAKRQKNQHFYMDSYAVIYAPHDRRVDGVRMNPGEFDALLGENYQDEDRPRKADIVFEISDQISGKTLVIDFFPSRYSFYGRRNKDISGVDLEEAAEILSERTRGRKTLADQSLLLDHARATYREPSLNITLFDRDRDFIAGMHGEVARWQGFEEGDERSYGFEMSPAFTRNGGKFSSVKVFLPISSERSNLFKGIIGDLTGLEIRKRQFGRQHP